METISAAFDWLVWVASRELLLFAAIGIMLIGVDDLLFDGLWMAAARRGGRANSRLYPDEPVQGGLARTFSDLYGIEQSRMPPGVDGAFAIFLPVWDEYQVLPDTLAHMLAAWDGEDFCIYIGCYPNDQRTILSVSGTASVDNRLRLVVADRPGPTTKGHNLNQMWLALGADERATGRRYAAIILHDAEDIVHPDELALYRRMLPRHSMVQIPVHAIVNPASQWISGHYADEFAEAHGKELALRSALGLPIPSAGVGCALSRDAVSLLAMERDGLPFRADSLTEDYEIGILIGTYGLSATFVSEHTQTGDPIVSKGEFPGILRASVRQKARWITGIALAGWGHLGWPALPAVKQQTGRFGTWLSYWMLWRDRRTPLAAIVMLAAYLGVGLSLVHAGGRWLLGWEAMDWGRWMDALLAINMVMLSWRMIMRAYFTRRTYGWKQGLLSLPRAFVANVVAIMASYQAVKLYFQMVRSGQVVWAKTDHSKSVRYQASDGKP